MLLNIDSIYKITFDEGFTDINGIYKVLQIINHDKLLELEIDLVATLYAAVSKTQDDYDEDKATYITGLYYQIVDVTDEAISYYVPASIISLMPDMNVNEYQKIVIAFDIGTFNDSEELATINTTIKDILTANHGITTTPQLMTYDKLWLTDTEYAVITDARTAAKTGATNYYSEAVRLELEVAKRDAKITALENIIIALQ